MSRRRFGSTRWAWITYAAMLLAAAAIFLVIRGYGETLSAPAPGAAIGRAAAADTAA